MSRYTAFGSINKKVRGRKIMAFLHFTILGGAAVAPGGPVLFIRGKRPSPEPPAAFPPLASLASFSLGRRYKYLLHSLVRRFQLC